MGEKWSLLNFQELMKSILSGKRCIQEPILIPNKKRNTTAMFSFLSHLLSYQNIHKENLLEVLASIYSDFQKKIHLLKENEIVQTMMDRINNEWYDPDYIFTIENPIPEDFFDMNNKNKTCYDKSCKVCEEVKQLSKIENNIPLKLYKDEVHPLDKHFRKSITLCKESIQYLERNCESILAIINHLKKDDMSQYIDLSIKHKSSYLRLSNKEDMDDESIPENIHRIFSNYIHIHNLLLKQMIQYYHYILHLKDEVKKECQLMETMKQNVQSIAYFEEEEDSEGDEEGSEEEDVLTVIDGEIKGEGGEEEGEEGKKGGFNFLSFF